jgi:quinolinate synthase
MRLITLKKLYLTLVHEWPEVHVDQDVITAARRPIDEMLRISKELGL